MDGIYTYADQLISETWIDWSERILSKLHGSKYNTSRGFQNAHGSANANERTRALELFNLGVIRGPLVAPKVASKDVPIGWKLNLEGKNIQTPLGYAAFAIGKSLANANRSSVIESSLSSLCAIFTLQLGISSGQQGALTSSLFLYLLKQLPKPGAVPELTWNRYVAAVMFCTLQSRTSELLKDFSRNTTPTSLILVKDSGTTAITLPTLIKLIGAGESFFNVKPAKAPLYWIGDPSDIAPRGIFTLASKHTHLLLEAAYVIDAKAASAGAKSPFSANWERGGTSEVPNVLNDLGDIFEANGFRTEWRRTMDSLKKGVIDSIRYLEEDNVTQTPRILYTHGCILPDVTPDKVDVEAETGSCSADPLEGDLLVIGSHTYKVRTAKKEGASWMIHAEVI